MGSRKRRSDAPAPERTSKRLKEAATTGQSVVRESPLPAVSSAPRRQSSGLLKATLTGVRVAATDAAEVTQNKCHARIATTSSNTSATSTAGISAEDGAPKWFSSTLVMLQSSEMPSQDRWMELLNLWKAFEEKEGYEENGFLCGTGRPKCIGSWIGVGCSTTWRPVLPKTSAFEKEFRQWWISLQPDWRVSEEGSIISGASEGDWGKLRKPGLNGIQGALAALFYWGLEVKRNVRQHKGWVVHVED
jgi:hypothetical protein